jgi:5-methylcytosine-specific restriction endonuclease McrA
MRHRSKKKEAEYELRRPLVARLLAERPWCEACPVFAGHDEKVTYVRKRSVDVHERIRRSQGGSILDEANLMCVCRDCHRRIGNYPALAFELGLARPGWTRDA